MNRAIILLIAAIMLVSQAAAIRIQVTGEGDKPANQSQTIDAFSPSTCEKRLNLTQFEMERQIDYFSRRLDVENFQNALTIFKNLTEKGAYKGKLLVHTWELYDKAFEFPRVRRYQLVEESLDMLEHFEDNLNLNIDNKQHLANFIRVATTVRKNLVEKYGEVFKDPANEDPWEDTEKEWSDI